MTSQKYFKYHFSEIKDYDNFFVNETNQEAYNLITNNKLDQNIFLFAPIKSGKSHLLNMWKEKNNALVFNGNLKYLIKVNKNIVIDDILDQKLEEEIFHIINHCKLFNLKILVTSSIELTELNYKLKDLFSRLRSFYYVKINNPDDEMCKMIMTKFFYEKQIIVKNKDIFDFIFNRVDRTYYNIFSIVEKIDKLSLEKKRQLTIPLIKEIL